MLIDANALIKRIPLRQVINPSLTTNDQFYSMYELYTLSEVVAELKDEKTRQYIENLPFDLKVEAAGSLVDEGDLQFVEQFAKETGDLGALSRVDKLVIAAGVTMARRKGEHKLVKKAPPSIEEFRPKSFKDFYEKEEAASLEENNDEDEAEELADIAEKPEEGADDDGFTVTAGKRRGRGKQPAESEALDDFVEITKGRRRNDHNQVQD